MDKSRFLWQNYEANTPRDFEFLHFITPFSTAVGPRVILITAFGFEELSTFNLDLKKRSWTHVDVNGYIPRDRIGFAATLAEDKIYIFGGERFADSTFLSDAYYLDLLTYEWMKLSLDYGGNHKNELPKLKYHVSEFVVGLNSIIIFGGVNMVAASNATYLLELDSLRLRHLETKGRRPESQWGYNSCVVSDYFFVYAGLAEEENLHMLSFHSSIPTWYSLRLEARYSLPLFEYTITSIEEDTGKINLLLFHSENGIFRYCLSKKDLEEVVKSFETPVFAFNKVAGFDPNDQRPITLANHTIVTRNSKTIIVFRESFKQKRTPFHILEIG